MTALRVLLVEDSPTDAKLVARALQSINCEITLERVETAKGLRAALECGLWDVVLSDWSLPQFSARAALEIVKSMDLDLPFIIVSGTIGEELAIEAMRAGAHDYVLKDKLTRLAPAVEREIRERKSRGDRRAAEKALHDSELRYRRLAESGVIGIVVADLEGHILEANKAYLTMMGYERAELIGGPVLWPHLAPPEAAPQMVIAEKQLSAVGVAAPWEMDAVRKDGTRAPMLVGVAMLDDSKCIAFAADLTEQKRVEEALLKSDLQLRQAQKMEAVGRLAGGVAHDFNNALSVILSYGDLMLLDLGPNDPMREDVEEIRKAGRRAADLTRQLLIFSRQQVLEPKILNLNDVLSSMDQMLKRLVGEDVDLSLRAGDDLATIKADPSNIEQAVMNLVVNARDAMPIGGKLVIETANIDLDSSYELQQVVSKAGPHVMLSITDSGIGMDASVQAHIFEPFFTTKPKDKGTGLGLSTVFGIAHQSGGGVSVHSAPGQGTTFKVYFPRVDERERTARTALPTATTRGSETILLVEDDEPLRNVARDILVREGYDVCVARGANEALALCEKKVGIFDLVITDVVMPQMSGPELAKLIAKGWPETTVLFMSGYTDDSVMRHGVLEGEIAYLQKPITPLTLANKVRELLDEPDRRKRSGSRLKAHPDQSVCNEADHRR
ncbi:MAG: response regulator [Polyangiaceae bacterium]